MPETLASNLAGAPSGLPEQLGVMMGADLLERFTRAGLDAAGQRRSVTVLFADLSGYTALSESHDSEEVYELIQQFMRLLVNDVYRYEGTVDKFTGDGIMALFGAPVAHENNAERAVRAALDMLADVQRLSQQTSMRWGIELKMRLGLNAGEVVVGGIGSNQLLNYTAIGDTVNLAHRLEEASATGAITVSESVYRQTRPLFDYAALPSMTLKGISHPVSAYQVVSVRPVAGSLRGLEGLSAPMVGRSVELGRLQAAVQRLAQHGEGGFALISGEAGIGKSRLSAELKHHVTGLPVTIAEGHVLTYRRSVSFWLFQEALRNLLGLSASSDPQMVSARLAEKAGALLGRHAGESLPYLEHLLGLPHADPASRERIALQDASLLRQQTFLAVRQLLAAQAAIQPVLLILEDLHWADDSSLDLIAYLVESLPVVPVLMLAISRPPEGELAQIVEKASRTLRDRCLDIRLQTLSAEDSASLLSKLLQMPSIPAALSEQVLGRSGGVPFYMEEILRMLIDDGVIRRQDNLWRVSSGLDVIHLSVPETLQGLILARYDRLDPLTRRVVQVASVIGREFDFRLLLETLAPMAEGEVREALQKLAQRDFISLQEPEAGAPLVFRHVLVSDAVYSTLLKRDRATLHTRVGESLEKLSAGKPEPFISLLARHFSLGGRLDKALHYLILAAQKSAREYANAQARDLYEQALAVLPQVEATPFQHYQVQIGMGDVLLFGGEFQPAQERYRAALDALRSDPAFAYLGEQSTLQRKIATTYERQGDYENALAYLQTAQNILDQLSGQRPVEKAQILNDTGWIHFRRGNLALAEETLLAALGLTEETSRLDVTASIYNRLGGVCYQTNRLDQARDYVQKSMALRERIGDTVAVARSLNNLGLINWIRGDWSAAQADFQRSFDLHSALGDIEGMIELRSNLGLLYLDQGNLEASRAQLENSLSGALQIGLSYMEGLACMNLCRYWLYAGDLQRCLEFGQRSLTVYKELGSTENLPDLYVLLGDACLALGDESGARQAARQALVSCGLDGGEPSAPPLALGRVLRLQAYVLLRDGDVAGAVAALRASDGYFKAASNRLEQGRTALALARALHRGGDASGSREQLALARAIFEKIGARLDLQQAQPEE